VRLWIDTDVGTNPDDAIAILLACRHPDVTVVGASTVTDDEHARATVARRLLASQGLDDVPVVAGSGLDPRDVAAAAPDALLAIGPLTTVARLVAWDVWPERVTVMGGIHGRVRHRGAWRETETNFASDPDAAALVVDALDPVIVPLDVTAAVVLTGEERARLDAHVPALQEPLGGWADPVCIHDPVALFTLVDEPFTTVDRHPLRVDERGRLRDDGATTERRVVVAVDRDAAIARMFHLLVGERR
jgi:purine nucleosidase